METVAKMSKKSTSKNARMDSLKDHGFTVRSFALKHGHRVSTCYAAIHGLIDGPEARQILKAIDQIITNEPAR